MKLPHYLFVASVGILGLLGGGCTKQLRAHRALSSAKSDFDAGHFDAAEIECRKVLLLNPQDQGAVRELALIYFAEGRMVSAYVGLQKALTAQPADVDLQLKFAQAAAAIGRRVEARDTVKKVLAAGLANEDSVMLLAQTGSTAADFAESRQRIEQLEQKGPDLAAYPVGLGIILLREKQPAAAAAEFRRALALDPKSDGAYLGLASVDLLDQDTAKAGPDLKAASDYAPLRSLRRVQYLDFLLRTHPDAAAKQALADFIQQAPDYLPGLVLAMKFAYVEHRTADATALARNVLERDPVNYDGLLETGVLLTDAGDAAGAILDLKKADRMYHTSEVLFRLALAYVKKGDSANAAACLEQALVLTPNFEGASLLLANVEMGRGNVEAGISRLQQLVKTKPKTTQPFLMLAHAYLLKKQPAAALALYAQAEQEFPRDPQLPYLQAYVLNQQGRRTSARQALAQALALDPTFGPALEMIVDADLTDRQYGLAEARVDALIARYPKNPVPLILRAKIRVTRHQVGPAESDLLQAIALDPNSPSAYLILSRLYLAADKQQEAVDKLSVLADKTNSVTSLMQLALLQTQLRHYDAAASAYQRLLKVDPNFSPALNNLAVLYAQNLGQLDTALDLARRALALRPDDPSTADTLGTVLSLRHGYREALPLLQSAVEAEPANPEIQYHFGAANYMLGNEEPARLALRQAVAADTDFPGKDEARRELAVLDFNSATATPDARKELQAWIQAHPDDAIARLRQAATQERGGSDSAAAANLEAALKDNPNDNRSRLELAQLYAGPLKNPARARELAKLAHEQAPDDPEISATLGRVLARTGDYAWSLTLLQEAARENPSQPSLNYDLARAYYRVGNLPAATAALQNVLTAGGAFPEREDAVQLAALIGASEDPAQLGAQLPVARTVLAAEPDSVPALMVTARAAEQQGDAAAAARIYEAIVALNPSFTPAVLRLVRLDTLKLKRFDRAYELAVPARASLPDDPDLTEAIGIVQYQRGNFQDAEQALAASVSQRADDPETVYYLGMAHYKLHQRGTGKAELQHALALKLAGPEADEARRALADIDAAVKAESQE